MAKHAPECCELCGRNVGLQFHHLIPRKNHGKTWFKRNFDKQEMRLRGAWLCSLCHRFIHRQFDEQTLGRQLNTVAALQAEQSVQTHIAWAAKQRRA